jgi:hypothetical protein
VGFVWVDYVGFVGGLKGLFGLFLWIVGRVFLWVVSFGFCGCS